MAEQFQRLFDTGVLQQPERPHGVVPVEHGRRTVVLVLVMLVLVLVMLVPVLSLKPDPALLPSPRPGSYRRLISPSRL